MNIEFGFSQKDAYDFVIKNERRERMENGKRITEKFKTIKYKNPEIDCWGHVERMTANNAPQVLKNVEYFTAPCPFGKYGTGKHYEPYGWTMPMALLAFEKGYIDGFLTSKGGLFQPAFIVKTEGIIVVDPIQRLEIRKYFENEFKNFLEHCKEEDFEYSLEEARYSTRLGINKEDTLQYIRDWVENELTSLNPKLEEALKKYGKEKFVEANSNLIYYAMDMYNVWGERSANPLTFKSKKDAETFAAKYNEWEDICGEEEKEKFNIIPVNEKFDNWIRFLVKEK